MSSGFYQASVAPDDAVADILIFSIADFQRERLDSLHGQVEKRWFGVAFEVGILPQDFVIAEHADSGAANFPSGCWKPSFVRNVSYCPAMS